MDIQTETYEPLHWKPTQSFPKSWLSTQGPRSAVFSNKRYEKQSPIVDNTFSTSLTLTTLANKQTRAKQPGSTHHHDTGGQHRLPCTGKGQTLTLTTQTAPEVSKSVWDICLTTARGPKGGVLVIIPQCTGMLTICYVKMFTHLRVWCGSGRV